MKRNTPACFLRFQAVWPSGQPDTTTNIKGIQVAIKLLATATKAIAEATKATATTTAIATIIKQAVIQAIDLTITTGDLFFQLFRLSFLLSPCLSLIQKALLIYL